MSFSSGSHRPTGFTLIELLVVIAIISILAAILFPVFAQAREKARQTACLSNTKQIGIALLMYAQDFDEAFPISYYATASGSFSASNTPQSWPRIIQPYVKNTQIFLCPSAPKPGNTPGTGDTAQNRFPVTYAYNYYLGGNFSPTGVTGTTLAGTDKAASTVVLADGTATPVENASPVDWKPKVSATAVTGAADTLGRTGWLLVHAGSTTVGFADYGAPSSRHAQMSNVLFADAHAKSLRVEKFYTLPGKEAEGKPADAGQQSWSPCLDPRYGCTF